jgi:hypothetical protein
MKLLLTPPAKKRGLKAAANLRAPEFKDVDFCRTRIERSCAPQGAEELLFRPPAPGQNWLHPPL